MFSAANTLQGKILSDERAASATAKPTKKLFTLEDINDLCNKLTKHYIQLGKSIAANELKVSECKQYFGNMFGRKKDSSRDKYAATTSIEELSSMLSICETVRETQNDSGDEKKAELTTTNASSTMSREELRQLSQNIGEVLAICDTVESQPIIIQATNALSDILNENQEYSIEINIGDDDESNWTQICHNLQEIKSRFGRLTLTRALTKYRENEKDFVVFAGDKKLQQIQLECLRVISGYRRIIGELVEQFGNDDAFREKMQTWHRTDDVEKGRSKALESVRRVIVENFIQQQLLNNDTKNENVLSKVDLRGEIMKLCDRMTEKFLGELKMVTSQWRVLRKLIVDQMTQDFQENSENLQKIYSFHFKMEEKLFKNINPAYYKRASNYLTVELTQCHNEKYIFDDSDSTRITATNKDRDQHKDVDVNVTTVKAEKTDEKAPDSTQVNVLTSHEFTTGIDNILLYLASNSASVSDEPVRNIGDLTVEGMIGFFNSRKQQLIDIGLQKIDILVTIMSDLKINGKKLIDAARQCSVDDNNLESMSKLLNYGVDTKIISAMVKIVNFEELRELAEDALKKYEVVDKILNFRLIYFAEGGREMLKNNRCIQINEHLDQFEQICTKWEEYVLNWQAQVNEQRKTYSVLSFFTVNDMRFIWQQMNDYNKHRRDIALNSLHTKLSFIDNNNISIDDVVSVVTSKETENLFTSGDSFNGGKLESLGKALKECLKDKIGRIKIL